MVEMWNSDRYVDTGDMESVSERACLIALVRRAFVTRLDVEWDFIKDGDLSKVRRDLSNLGLSLVVDGHLGVAWAAQVPRELRGNVPLCRREAIPERGQVCHAALCLRRHWDEREGNGEADPHITDDELRAIVAAGPLGKVCADDGEALERGFVSVRDRLSKIGLIRLDRDAQTWRLLPTVLVLVSEEMCARLVANADHDDEDKNVEAG